MCPSSPKGGNISVVRAFLHSDWVSGLEKKEPQFFKWFQIVLNIRNKFVAELLEEIYLKRNIILI